MEQINPPQEKSREIQIVAGLKVVETEYRIKVPVFEDVTIQRPTFIEQEIKMPVGFEKVASEMAFEISKAVLALVEAQLHQKLDRIIDDKLASLKNLKTVEEVTVIHREVEVERPVYKDVEISLTRPVYIDKEIVNPVIKDVEVVNAVIIDRAVVNAVIDDIRVTNAIIKDVEVERAVIREKVIEVIHKQCMDEKGNPL